MGIQKFFSSISKSSFVKNFDKNKKISTEYFYIDFNSIIHVKSAEVISNLNYLLWKIIKKKTDDGKLLKFIKLYDIKIGNSLEDFLKNVNKDKIDKIIINEVIKYVQNHLLQEMIDSEKLKYFYIAIDGVPSKAKMVEQKKEDTILK